MKLTKEQCIILTGYTGCLIGDFGTFHEEAEKRLGRPIFTHEFGNGNFSEELKEAYKDDFMALMPD